MFGQSAIDDCSNLTEGIQIQEDSIAPYVSFVDKHRKIGAIQNSTSDFEIRYYVTPSLVNGGGVIVINCYQGSLKAQRINYWFNPKKSYEKRKVKKVEVIDLQPVTSWVAFIDSLKSLGFFTLPTMSKIRPKMKKYMTLKDGRTVEKRVEIMDGAIYTFEIKIGDKIRTFSYHSPMAWYRTYDNVRELKLAGEIQEHFVNDLKKID